jgi:RNA polymerase sigma-70 factor (ECF subfamily)
VDADDAELLAGLRRGDPATFNRAYAKHRAKVYGFLLRLSRRRDVADDLLQETWMKLARSAPSLREDSSLLPWLFSVARNEFLSWRRWSLLDVTRLLSFEAESAEAHDVGPQGKTEASARLALIERALGELSRSSREVLLLVGVEGIEQEQVADILGIGYAALRQRLSRARAELAQRVAALEERTASAKLKRTTERGAT